MIRFTIFTILILLITLSIAGFTQQWPVEIVRSNLDGAWIRAGDFDNDNDADLLIQNGDTLFWYENLQPGWAEHLIDTQFLNSSTSSVEVFDLDQDGDLDVLQFPVNNPSVIAWNENSMNGMNWEKHVISTTVNQPSNMPGAYGDLDGDNDIDFAVPSWGDGSILWFENISGDTTWQEHQVANIGSNAIWTTFADMDGDNDLDIVGARYFSGDIIWYENQLPNTDWTTHPIATLPGTAIGIGMDMDEDGDQDIVTHSNISNQLIWYENPSWAGHTITKGIIGLLLGPVGDIDQDGDPDVAFGGQHSFGWCENLGNSTSWKLTILDSIHNQFPSPVDLEDINGDNFLDMTAYTLDIFGNGLGDARWYANPLASSGIIRVPEDYPTIQAGIEAASNGNTVLVADGTYFENINFNGKAITVASHFLIDGDETHIGNTIIDGSQPSHPDSGSVVFFISGEDTNSVLCGFTITGGTGTIAFVFNLDVRLGGGIFVFESGATIKNNIIESNVIQYDQPVLGGGIAAISDFEQNFIIENNIIRNNSITSANVSVLGGGIYSNNIFGSVRIANNIIMDNTITAPIGYGGGILPDGPGNENYFVINNVIAGNIVNAPSGGSGGIDIIAHSFPVRNNLIINNSAPRGGGILIEFTTNKANLISGRGYDIEMSGQGDNYQFSFQGVPLLENNTVINNTATVEGGGLAVLGPITPILMNSIIWGNTAPTGPQISGTADVQYSDVEGGYTGTGNIDEHPLFDMGSEFYHLWDTSPCIDAGNPDPQYNDVEDPSNPGNPLYPAWGTLRNDMGHGGGPASRWGFWDWPIPVELTSFTASTSEGKVYLNWTTATEINNLGFEIERKIISNEINGVWSLVGFREGYGTTTEQREYSYVDDISTITATSFAYRLKQIDFDGSYEYSDEVMVDIPAPTNYSLAQNYPNPFNPVTTISYSLPLKSQVELVLYNTLGEEVIQLVNGEKEAGSYSVKLNATGLPSGIYFYRIQAGKYVETKKMLLLK